MPRYPGLNSLLLVSVFAALSVWSASGSLRGTPSKRISRELGQKVPELEE
jgi:hypothetical protein